MPDTCPNVPVSTNSVPMNTVHPVAQGINLPKIGTLIPNRIFVGGISSTTTEEELRTFFSVFGAIKDVKVIHDKSGQSKGSYGFVTFEDQHTAESVIKNEAESLILKDRKLNIGYAVRKQHIFQKHELGSTLLVAHNACALSNGLSLLQLCPHDHSVIGMNHMPTFCYPTALVVPSNMPSHPLCTSVAANGSNASYSPLVNPHASSIQVLSAPTNFVPVNTIPFGMANTPRTVQQASWKSEDTDACGRPRTTVIMNTSNLTSNDRPNHSTVIRTAPFCDTHHCHWLPSVPRLSYRPVLRSFNGMEQQPHRTSVGRESESYSPSASMAFNNAAAVPPTSLSADSTEVRKLQVPLGMDVCRCKTAFFEPTQNMQSEKWDTQTHGCIPEGDATTVYPSAVLDEACGNQCAHKAQLSPVAQLAPIGTPKQDRAERSSTQWAYPYTTTASTSNNLVQRILQSHPSEPPSDNGTLPSTVYPNIQDRATVGKEYANCLNDQYIKVLCGHTGTKQSSSFSNVTTTSPAAISQSSSLLNPSCFMSRPAHTGTRGFHPVEVDNEMNNDAPYDRELFTNFMQQSTERSPDHLSSDPWFDSLRSADPFAPRRFLGLDLMQTNRHTELADETESKISRSLLASPGNTTTACGDISKLRQD